MTDMVDVVDLFHHLCFLKASHVAGDSTRFTISTAKGTKNAQQRTPAGGRAIPEKW